MLIDEESLKKADLLARTDVFIWRERVEAKGFSGLGSHSMEIGECTTSSSQSIRWNSPPFYDPQAIEFAEHAVQDYTWFRIHDIHVFRLLPDTLTRYPHVFEERKCDLETAKALDPHDIGRWPRWKLFHSQRSTAIVSVKNVSNDNPDNITALFLHEQLYQRLNSKMQAQAAYTRIIDAKDPKLVDKDPSDRSEVWILKKKRSCKYRGLESDFSSTTMTDSTRALLLRARIFVCFNDSEAAHTDYNRV